MDPAGINEEWKAVLIIVQWIWESCYKRNDETRLMEIINTMHWQVHRNPPYSELHHYCIIELEKDKLEAGSVER